MTLRVFCFTQDYRSHRHAAQAYLDIFASLPESLVTLVDDPDEANVSYLHLEQDKALKLLEDIPSLKKTYKVGYCVWEANRLPEAHINSIKQFDEIWTASWHNWLMYDAAHPRARWIPHVTGCRQNAERSDIEAMRESLHIGPDDFVFLFIGEELPRKNIGGLVEAFHHVQQRQPRARLIIKTNGESTGVRFESKGPITYCRGDFSSAQIAALYALCQSYVSPHCGEGWGLTLVEAMQQNKLCVSTGYSGNMDFTTPANSLLIDYTVDSIPDASRYHLFTKAMSWAEPHQESIEQQMLKAISLVQSGKDKTMTARAARDIRTYDARHIRCLVKQRLRQIARLLATRASDPIGNKAGQHAIQSQ